MCVSYLQDCHLPAEPEQKLTGQFTGTYTGGGMNFAALGQAFDTSSNLFTAAIAADVILTAIWMAACLAVPVLLGKQRSSTLAAPSAEVSDKPMTLERLLYSSGRPLLLADAAALVAIAVGTVWVRVRSRASCPFCPRCSGSRRCRSSLRKCRPSSGSQERRCSETISCFCFSRATGHSRSREHREGRPLRFLLRLRHGSLSWARSLRLRAPSQNGPGDPGDCVSSQCRRCRFRNGHGKRARLWRSAPPRRCSGPFRLCGGELSRLRRGGFDAEPLGLLVDTELPLR